MNVTELGRKIRYGSFYIPFRFQLVVLGIALSYAYKWLRATTLLPETAYTAIIDLFITITLYFISALIIIAFITSFLPWLLFILRKKQGQASLKVSTAAKPSIFSKKQEVTIDLQPVMRPLFGYIRLRLEYDNLSISPKFSLLRAGQRSFFSSGLHGIYNWPLPEIKEYKVNGGIIYFEDMFQVFSFTAGLPSQDVFFTQPENDDSTDVSVRPKKTEDTNTRIDQIRKVEGEFLNYKNFEDNDDVRRIVWKIYAKNKELVIRIPETNDPYASHVYFYSSFYNSIGSDLYPTISGVFLNQFKTIVWNAYLQLNKKSLLLKYVPDQPAKTMFADDPLQKIKYIISTSNWHHDKDLATYFRKDEASVLCISSFTDVEHLENIVSKSGKDLVVIFVELSKTFQSIKVRDWLQWLFVRPSAESVDKLKISWNISPLKRKVTENESRIKRILDKSECEKVMA